MEKKAINPAALKFKTDDDGYFGKELKKRVYKYLDDNQILRTGTWKTQLKVAFCLSLLPVSWVQLVFFSSVLYEALIYAFLLAQAYILIGFNVMHSAIHGALFASKTANKILGYSLNVLGALEYFWRHKHNVLHHNKTNVDGLDSDLEPGWLLRMSPFQKWRVWHLFQIVYFLPLYGLLAFSMLLFGDIQKAVTRKIGNVKLRKKMPRKEVWILIVTKVFHLAYMLVIPMCIHPPMTVLIFYVGINVLIGLTISLVFQLAHVVDNVTFRKAEDGVIKRGFSEHELDTTSDFCISDKWYHRLISWYVGGLNFQVIHHLFPEICPEHYRKLVGTVQKTCVEFYSTHQTVYRYHKTLLGALAAHCRQILKLSLPWYNEKTVK